MDCIFCAIARGEIPCKKVYEDERVLAFEDVSPQAPVHILVIPKNHAKNLLECAPQDIEELHRAVVTIVKDLQLEEKGFRLVVNTGEMGGQTVEHLHYHLLAGRNLQWPPG